MNSLLVISFLNELELICLPSSIAIVSTQLNGFNHRNLTLVILFDINHRVVTSIGFEHHSFTHS